MVPAVSQQVQVKLVRSIKGECLNRIIFFGENSLRETLLEYTNHYHEERNHLSVSNWREGNTSKRKAKSGNQEIRGQKSGDTRLILGKSGEKSGDTKSNQGTRDLFWKSGDTRLIFKSGDTRLIFKSGDTKSGDTKSGDTRLILKLSFFCPLFLGLILDRSISQLLLKTL